MPNAAGCPEVSEAFMKLASFIALPIILLTIACDKKPVVEPPSDFTLGTPTVSGTATAGDNVRTILLPDGKNIVFEIDQFTLAAGGGSPGLARKSLTLAVPFSVPDGYKVKFKSKDILGQAELKEGASLKLALESFYAGGVEPKAELELTGPLTTEINFKDLIVADEEGFSECGADVTLRVNFSVLLKSSGEETSTVSITQIGDDEGALEFEWKKCD